MKFFTIDNAKKKQTTQNKFSVGWSVLFESEGVRVKKQFNWLTISAPIWGPLKRANFLLFGMLSVIPVFANIYHE